jgi:phosphatidylcholine synthase
MDQPGSERFTPAQTIFAWMVHALTASGTVLAFLALTAIVEENWPLALLWLIVALAIDGIDGSLARIAHVKIRIPRIDGETLDLIVDYLNYVFIPTVIIWRAGLVPPSLAAPLAGLILVSSLYNFTRRDLKTEDNYFRGFPALWNVVAFYLFVTRPSEAAAAAVIFLLAGITFTSAPIIHPFRVRDYGRWPPILATLWAFTTAALLWPGWDHGLRAIILILSLATAAALLGLSLIRAFRGPRLTPAQ